MIDLVVAPEDPVKEPVLPQDPAHRLLGERDAELLPDPANQAIQAPAHHAMNRRDRVLIDQFGQPSSPIPAQLRGLARRLAVDQPLRARASGPEPLKRCTQSRKVWRSMPPILAASARV